jgi:hypothetical protein
MTDYDRGAYTPQSDAPLAFDARHSRGGGGGGGGMGGPSSATLIVSGVVLLLLIIALLVFYRSGVRRGDAAPQVVGTPITQTKSAPPASGQPAEPAVGLQVYKTEVAPPSEGRPAPTFTKPPEQPAARPAPTARDTTPTITSLEPPAADSTPPPKLRAAQANPDTGAPVAKAVKPARAVASAPAAQAKAATAAPGGVLVQIGAFSSAALAEKGWNDVAGLMPGAMAGKTKAVEQIEGKTPALYRAYVGGFASKIEAKTFCTSLEALGKHCFVK